MMENHPTRFEMLDEPDRLFSEPLKLLCAIFQIQIIHAANSAILANNHSSESSSRVVGLLQFQKFHLEQQKVPSHFRQAFRLHAQSINNEQMNDLPLHAFQTALHDHQADNIRLADH